MIDLTYQNKKTMNLKYADKIITQSNHRLTSIEPLIKIAQLLLSPFFSLMLLSLSRSLCTLQKVASLTFKTKGYNP